MSDVDLAAENARLHAVIGGLRSRIAYLERALPELSRVVSTPHDWRHEVGTRISRCTVCGTRTSAPEEVMLSCMDVRAEARKKRRYRGRTG